MRKEYDLIVPFGFNCGSAAQLRSRKLRIASFPFDWVLQYGGHDFELFVSMLANDFSGFLSYDDLLVVDLNGGDRHVIVENMRTHVRFVHDFNIGRIGDRPDKGEWMSVQEKYRRRADRLSVLMAKAGSILFVSGVDLVKKPCAPVDLIDVQQRLKALHPGKIIDLFVVMYNSDRMSVESFGESVVCQFTPRSWIASYDANRPVYEYSFLDGISLSGLIENARAMRSKEDLDLLERLVYSLTKKAIKFMASRKIQCPRICDYT